MLWAIAGDAGDAGDRQPSLPGAPAMREQEIADRFAQDFTLERVAHGKGRWKANWYTLRRR